MPTRGLITLPAFARRRDGVRHFFGTRHDPRDVGALGSGDESVRCVVSVTQVHGTDALVLDRPVKGGETFAGGWDALVTDEAGVLLTIRTADCLPVLVHDSARNVVAALHVGWRGAVAGIVPKSLSLLHQRFGSTPESLQIGIGPSVGPCCYEVDEPVLSRLRAGFRDWRSVVGEAGPKKCMLDLHALVRRQAQGAGVDGDRIRSVRVCTACHPDLFYSYRREGTVKGTMISGIMLSRRRSR